MQTYQAFPRQRGAALVIGMMLLLVLTLLAVSGMNASSTELIMAGNTQYREGGFQAAETGIEQALRNGSFNPGTALQTMPTGTMANGIDQYVTTITPQPAPNTPMQALWGNRWDSFSTFHFSIESRGTSLRNATTTNTQGMFVVAPFDPGTPPPLTGVSTALTAP